MVNVFFLPHDIQRLEAYTRNQIEYRLILDLMVDVSMLFFQQKLNRTKLDALQKVHIFKFLFVFR